MHGNCTVNFFTLYKQNFVFVNLLETLNNLPIFQLLRPNFIFKSTEYVFT